MNLSHPLSERAAIKHFAKKAAKVTGCKLSFHHEQFSKALGYRSYSDLNSRCEQWTELNPSSSAGRVPVAISEVLQPRPEQNVPFRFRVGRRTWRVEGSTFGPLLSVEGSNTPRVRAVSLGLYPVIVRKSDGSFVITRYGHERVLDLGFYGVDEVVELGRLAGIPVWPRSTPWSRQRKQQVESQLVFLRSPAFAAIRRWMRAGGSKQVQPGDWISGLPCMTWTTLVALSDDNFAIHGEIVAETLFRRRWCSMEERDQIWTIMCDRWRNLSAEEAALDVPIGRLLSPAVRKLLDNV